MKRVFAIVLAMLVVVSVFAGCSKKAGPEGKYIVKTIGGMTVEEAFSSMLSEYGDGQTIEDLLKEAGIESIDEFMTIELKSDGKAVVDVALDEPSEGTWKQDGNKIIVTVDGDPVEFTLNGNELSFKEDEMDYVFIKK